MNFNIICCCCIQVNLKKWVSKGTDGRSTLFEVEKGVGHIISDMISKDKATMDKIRDIFQPRSMTLESRVVLAKEEVNSGKEKKKGKEAKPDNVKVNKTESQAARGSKDDAEKYQIFFNFNCRLPLLKSYQVIVPYKSHLWSLCNCQEQEFIVSYLYLVTT